MLNILARLLRGAAYSRAVIAVATIISITIFLFLTFPQRSRDLLSYTKIVTWDALWLEPRLKAFKLDEAVRREVYDCQYSKRNASVCPGYFAWIHEDLAPWMEGGISQESLEEAKSKADSRIVVVDGKLYHQQYHKCFQTRDDYTLVGLLLLLEKFPGMIPDLELYLVCGDFPQVLRKDYGGGKKPPPVFSYSVTRRGENYDVLIPDWSFWGWPEVNIQPWPQEREQIFDGAASSWMERRPLAHWKGNVWVGSAVRTDMLQCNNTKFNLLVYHQDWGAESRNGFKASSLSQQCGYRYKVYAEGRAWSVSLKYIAACGSTMLHIEPDFWEFFARSWLPYVHYWPLSRRKICPSVKYAVDWGNAFPAQAEAIGRCSRAFLEKELSMEDVYQYMLHLLQAYGKLLKFKPVAPEGVQAMSLNSTTLPYRDVFLRSNGRRGDQIICSLPPRNRAAIDKILARQAAGYEKASHQE